MTDLAGAAHFRNLNSTGINVTNGISRITKLEVTNSIVPAATAFVQFFDVAVSAVVLGTTRPAVVAHIPAATASVPGMAVLNFVGDPWTIRTRLSAFGTTTAEGNTGVASGIFLAAWVA